MNFDCANNTKEKISAHTEEKKNGNKYDKNNNCEKNAIKNNNSERNVSTNKKSADKKSD